MAVIIYHNPRCSKSRQTLALIAESGTDHTVVQYLEDAPDAPTLLDLAARLGLPMAGLLRRGEAVFKEAQDLPPLDDDARLASWLAEHPVVLERPIVIADDGAAVIGRPPENVLAMLSK